MRWLRRPVKPMVQHAMALVTQARVLGAAPTPANRREFHAMIEELDVGAARVELAFLARSISLLIPEQYWQEAALAMAKVGEP